MLILHLLKWIFLTKKKPKKSKIKPTFVALMAFFGIFFGVAFRAHWVSITFVECNSCDWFFAYSADEVVWMPWLSKCSQNLNPKKGIKSHWIYILKKQKIAGRLIDICCVRQVWIYYYLNLHFATLPMTHSRLLIKID